jgi:acyl carrier protein
LAELPLTPNGKVDRRALPAPEHTRAHSAESYVAARTPVEELLAAIWCEVLGLEQVGVHDNFFHLGGHSLLATQVSSRLRETFQVELPLRALFEYPSVAGLALQVENSLRAGTGLEYPPMVGVTANGRRAAAVVCATAVVVHRAAGTWDGGLQRTRERCG